MKCTLMGHPGDFDSVREAYDTFMQSGIDVIYPRRPEMEDIDAYVQLDFAKNEVGQFEDLLDAVRQSDFLYVDNPLNVLDRREIFCAGFAHALEKYVFSSNRVENLPDAPFLRELSPSDVVKFIRTEMAY